MLATDAAVPALKLSWHHAPDEVGPPVRIRFPPPASPSRTWLPRSNPGIPKRRQETFYSAVTPDDIRRERQVGAIVAENLSQWQAEGLVPDMRIEPGDKTDEPIRTRGWTHWHHLFGARQLFLLAKLSRSMSAAGALIFANELNFQSKLCAINSRSANSGRDMCLDRVFINQALNTLLNYGVRSFEYKADNSSDIPIKNFPEVNYQVFCETADKHNEDCEIYITDPPYADAIVYHEITEYFIAWLRKNPPPPFDHWVWDSRRELAIKGKEREFPPRHGRCLRCHDATHAGQRPAGRNVHPPGCRCLGRSRGDPLGGGATR